MDENFLNKIREYLKEEKQDYNQPHWASINDAECAQIVLQHHYYQVGRESMLEDILRWEQNLGWHEGMVRKKKGIL